MKKHILRFSQSNPASYHSFKNIRSGDKKVETRAATAGYKDIRAGDMLVLVCGKNRFEKRIKKVTTFKTIPDMLKKYKIQDIMPELSTKQELEGAYYSYPGYKDKIKKSGLIALEL